MLHLDLVIQIFAFKRTNDKMNEKKKIGNHK